MAEVLSDANVGRKRRLPVWMQGEHANSKEISGNQDKKVMLSEDQSETTDVQVKSISTKPPRRIRGIENGVSGREVNSERCEVKGRTKRVGRRNNDPSDSIVSPDETGLPKKELRKERGRIVRKRPSSKNHNRKLSQSKDSEVESISQESSGDEIELTVEDLISIAQEYVDADEKQHGSSATRKPNSTHLSSLSTFSKADVRRCTETTGCSQLLSRCTSTSISGLSETRRKEKETPPKENFRSDLISRCTTRCSSHPSKGAREEKESSTTEDLTRNVRGMGDAAQDMLDLFLGPLLKKPHTEGRDHSIAKIQNLTLFHESDRQIPCMSGWKENASQVSMAGWKDAIQEVRSMPFSKEEAPLTKKKSSLKDKVAVLLE